MSQSSNVDTLTDILQDFPAAAILQCTSLLEEILNTIGSPSIQSISSTKHAKKLDIGRLSASYCMTWCEQLVNKSIQSIIQLSDGSLTSFVVPSPQPTTQGPTLAAQMV